MACPHCHQSHVERGTGATYSNCPARDDRAIAYYTGAADARNGRPRRLDTADRGPIGAPYHRGYDSVTGR